MVRFFKTRFATAVIPFPDAIFFGEVRQGKYRKYEYFAREGKTLAEIFKKARSRGFGPDLALAASFEDFRMEIVRFPDMTEAELAETIFWETDRIFRTDRELSVDWKILSHSAEEYEVEIAACRADTLRGWAEAAKEAGCRFAWILPLPSLFGKTDAEIFVLAGNKDARLYLREAGRTAEKKRIDFADREEKVFSFLEGREEIPVFCLPSENCGEAAYTEWREVLGIGAEDADRKSLALFVGGKMEEALSGMNLAPEEDRVLPFFRKETYLLRGMQGACAAAALAVLVLGGQFWRADRLLSDEEARAAELFSVKEEMRKEEIARGQEEAVREEGKEFLSRARFGENLWLLLADEFPGGISLRSVERKGNEIVVEGRAESLDRVSALRKKLESAWNVSPQADILPAQGSGPSFSLRCRLKEEKRGN